MKENAMDDCIYDPELKAVIMQFGNVTVSVDIEEFMQMMYGLASAKIEAEKDEDLELGIYTNEEGIEFETFVVKTDSGDFN